jgi:hypothetical protein
MINQQNNVFSCSVQLGCKHEVYETIFVYKGRLKTLLRVKMFVRSKAIYIHTLENTKSELKDACLDFY